MDFFLIIVGIIIFWFVFKNKKQNNDDQNLTETQQKWRSQNNAHRSPEIEKTIQMNDYIIRYKRPFRVLEWLLTPVDPRIGLSYIFNISMILTVFVGGWLFFEFKLHADLMLISVLIVDFISYNKQLLCEVTIWNPEFREKFME